MLFSISKECKQSSLTYHPLGPTKRREVRNEIKKKVVEAINKNERMRCFRKG
jgi:hypothetical protein